MPKIHDEINRSLTDCHTQTGKKATRIYLGKSQMDRLMRWAKENQYVSDTEKRDGKDRPEIMGCHVYEINSEDHCFAA
jgi:hypothetical protein